MTQRRNNTYFEKSSSKRALIKNGLFERLACNFNSLLNWPGGGVADRKGFMCAPPSASAPKTKRAEPSGERRIIKELFSLSLRCLLKLRL